MYDKQGYKKIEESSDRQYHMERCKMQVEEIRQGRGNRSKSIGVSPDFVKRAKNRYPMSVMIHPDPFLYPN
jgi:hypothetical protein